MKHKTGIFAIGLFVVLGVLWLFLNGSSQHMEKSNQFSLSEIKYDDSTYRYVKEKCDSGLIPGSLYLKGILTRLMRINHEYDVF